MLLFLLIFVYQRGCRLKLLAFGKSIRTEYRYLVPADLNVGQFVYVVRKRIKLSPEKAILIFVKNILPPTAAMLSSIYEENKDEDGFLYMTYNNKNTFGIIKEYDQGMSV